MLVDVSSEVIIGRPHAIISEYAANPDNAPNWYVNIKSGEWTTPHSLGAGSQLRKREKSSRVSAAKVVQR